MCASASPLAVPGSASVVALRWLGLAALALPAGALWHRGIAAGAARNPYYTDLASPLPVVPAVRLFSDLPGTLIPVAVATALFAVLASQILTAAALAVLAPGRRSPPRLARSLREAGPRYLPAFLRVLFVAALLAVLGVLGLGAAFDRLLLAGKRAAWTAEAELVFLPTGRVLAQAAWLAGVGAWSLGCRAFLVAGEERRVRRVVLPVLRAFGRAPFAGPGLFVVATLGAQGLAGLVLILWLDRAPGGFAATAGWLGLWLGVMAVHAWVWHGLVRAALLLRAGATRT